MFGTTKFITLEAAKKMMAAGEAEARKNGWNVAITVVDANGDLIMFQKLDETQPGSVAISQGKARTAANFKRSTKVLEDALMGGKTAFLSVDGMTPMQGGVPVVADGKVIGAVGVSGVMSNQDEQVALAAVAALSQIGNEQHNPGTALHWDRSKSGDEWDALTRHLLEVGTYDTDGVRHAAKVAWRALAGLQKELEQADVRTDERPVDTAAGPGSRSGPKPGSITPVRF